MIKNISLNVGLMLLSILLIGLVLQFSVPEQALSENTFTGNSLESQEVPLETLTQENATVKLAEEIIRLKAKINRTFAYVQRLNYLAEQPHFPLMNTTKLKNLVQTVKGHLEKATINLKNLDIRAATTEFTRAKVLVDQLSTVYFNLSTEVKEMRVSNYLSSMEDRFKDLKVDITRSAQEFPDVKKNATMTALDNAQNNLKNARDLANEQKIPETVDELISFYRELDKSLTYTNVSRLGPNANILK